MFSRVALSPLLVYMILIVQMRELILCLAAGFGILGDFRELAESTIHLLLVAQSAIRAREEIPRGRVVRLDRHIVCQVVGRSLIVAAVQLQLAKQSPCIGGRAIHEERAPQSFFRFVVLSEQQLRLPEKGMHAGRTRLQLELGLGNRAPPRQSE